MVDDFVTQRVNYLNNKNEIKDFAKPSLNVFIERFESEMIKQDSIFWEN